MLPELFGIERRRRKGRFNCGRLRSCLIFARLRWSQVARWP